MFGGNCFASTLSNRRKKLDRRARSCVYLGHKLGVKGFVLYDIQTREIFISRNILFHDDIFPFHSASNANSEECIVPMIYFESHFCNDAMFQGLDYKILFNIGA